MANLPCRTVKQAGRGRQSAEKKVSLDHDGDWRTLHSIWQRGHACDSTPRSLAITRNAFAKTCRDTVPAEIIAAAKEHVAAAAAGDGVRYLPQLAQWLAARGWEQPPPTKAKSRSPSARKTGGRRDHLPRSNGGKVDLARLAFKMGGYVEDEDGKLHHPDGDFGSSLDWGASQ